MKVFLLVMVLMVTACQEDKVSKQDTEDRPVDLQVVGIVSAVDRDWGFVVITLDDGPTLERKVELLLTREGKEVGRVAVNVLEDGRAIADVSPGSFERGREPMAGDRVSLFR